MEADEKRSTLASQMQDIEETSQTSSLSLDCRYRAATKRSKVGPHADSTAPSRICILQMRATAFEQTLPDEGFAQE
jgi:hypothetical protein